MTPRRCPSQMSASGKLVAEETIVDGLDNAPAAFLGLPLDPEVREAVEAAARLFEKAGAVVEPA